MTLAEWEEQTGCRVRRYRAHGLRTVPETSIPDAERAQLWRLEDYTVSSVSGGSVWLWPRLGFTEEMEARAQGAAAGM